jgi:hypothetical protein
LETLLNVAPKQQLFSCPAPKIQTVRGRGVLSYIPIGLRRFGWSTSVDKSLGQAPFQVNELSASRRRELKCFSVKQGSTIKRQCFSRLSGCDSGMGGGPHSLPSFEVMVEE